MAEVYSSFTYIHRFQLIQPPHCHPTTNLTCLQWVSWLETYQSFGVEWYKCKCRVYMYEIWFVNHSYCYFFQHAYITNLYRCRPVINTCVYISASNGFYSLLFWIHELCIIIIYNIIKIIFSFCKIHLHIPIF